MSVTCRVLLDGFDRLMSHFGPRGWWPGDTPFEVMVGAILTQNTNWKNVERAISNLKRAKVLSPRRLYELPPAKLASLIRPAGYFRVKARRLRSFLKFFLDSYGGSTRRMAAQDAGRMRGELLSVNGIGPETADSIILYALGKPVFVVDAYTKRILNRHALCTEDADYNEIQEFFMDRLPSDVPLYNEYHALIVEAGKDYCRATPRCGECPLRGWNC